MSQAENKTESKAAPVAKGGVPKFEIYVGPNSMLHWRFVGPSGAPIIVSKGTAIREQCFQGIRDVKENANIEQRYEKFQIGEKFAFRLRAANHQVVAESVPYEKADDRDQAMPFVRRASEAVVIS